MTAEVREEYVAYCPDCNAGSKEPDEDYFVAKAWADEHNREYHSNPAEQEIADDMTRNDHK